MAEHNPAMSDLSTNEYIAVHTGNSSGDMLARENDSILV